MTDGNKRLFNYVVVNCYDDHILVVSQKKKKKKVKNVLSLSNTVNGKSFQRVGITHKYIRSLTLLVSAQTRSRRDPAII